MPTPQPAQPEIEDPDVPASTPEELLELVNAQAEPEDNGTDDDGEDPA